MLPIRKLCPFGKLTVNAGPSPQPPSADQEKTSVEAASGVTQYVIESLSRAVPCPPLTPRKRQSYASETTRLLETPEADALPETSTLAPLAAGDVTSNARG